MKIENQGEYMMIKDTVVTNPQTKVIPTVINQQEDSRGIGHVLDGLSLILFY